MNFRKVALLAAVFAFAVCGSAWAATDPCSNVPDLLFCHSFDQTGNAYSSQNDTTGGNGNFATVYDNFRFQIAEHINSVHWVGEYFNPPQQGPITGWTINFYADQGGQPGGLLQSNKVAPGCGAGQVCETFLGNFAGFPTYRYDLTSATDLFLTDNLSQFWMSVVPDLGFPPQWGWSSASNQFGDCNMCDGISYQDFFGSRSNLGVDLAFALDGSSGGGVPEPGTLVMLGTGVLGLAGAIRRKLI